MNTFSKNWNTVLNIFLAMIVLGIMHWTMPYHKIELISKFYAIYSTISAFIIGIIGVIFFKKNFLKAALFTTIGFIAAIFIRIIYDETFADSRDHNLFPIEIIIMMVYALPSSLIGAFISSTIIRLVNTIREKEN